MHEWALAESVIATALENAEKQKLKTISDITIQIGELQQIDHDIFKFALKELMKTQGASLKKTRVHLTVQQSTLTCTRCTHTWTYQDMKNTLQGEGMEAIHFIPEIALVYARCPSCGSPDFNITKGRGVSLTSIKGSR